MTDWIDKIYGPGARQSACRAEEIVAHLGAHLPPGTAAALRDLHALAHELGLLCWGDVGDRYLVIWESGYTALATKYDPDPARRLATEPPGPREQLIVLHRNIWPRYLSEVAPLVEQQFSAVAVAHDRCRNSRAQFSTRAARASHELAGVKAELAALKLSFLRLGLTWNPLWETHS
jgi:hypothetical protein